MFTWNYCTYFGLLEAGDQNIRGEFAYYSLCWQFRFYIGVENTSQFIAYVFVYITNFTFLRSTENCAAEWAYISAAIPTKLPFFAKCTFFKNVKITKYPTTSDKISFFSSFIFSRKWF